jgi:hypothetical protein
VAASAFGGRLALIPGLGALLAAELLAVELDVGFGTMTTLVLAVHEKPPVQETAIALPPPAGLPRGHVFCIASVCRAIPPVPMDKESFMGNFEDKDRDNKSENPSRQGQGQGQQGDRGKPGQQNEPGRESNVSREGQGQGSQRQGGTSPSGGRPKSDDDEESA